VICINKILYKTAFFASQNGIENKINWKISLTSVFFSNLLKDAHLGIEPMDPYGQALLDFFRGDHSAGVVVHRNDGNYLAQLPLSKPA